MKRKFLLLFLLGASVLGISDLAAQSGSSNWIPVGPNGGDARSFAVDPGNPQHLYLGTTTSWIYQSTDGGVAGKRLAKLGKADDRLSTAWSSIHRIRRCCLPGLAGWTARRVASTSAMTEGATWTASPEMVASQYALTRVVLQSGSSCGNSEGCVPQ